MQGCSSRPRKNRDFGREVDKKNVEEIRRRIGVVFQNPDDFLFNPTVKDELLYVPRQLDWSEEEMERVVEEYAEIFRISHVLNKPPFRLSGGEKKKVEIASVLVYRPEVLLLDEPTAYVDGKTRRLILKILEDFNGTLVIATHELDVAERLADKFILLNLEHRIEAVGGKEILKMRNCWRRQGLFSGNCCPSLLNNERVLPLAHKPPAHLCQHRIGPQNALPREL